MTENLTEWLGGHLGLWAATILLLVVAGVLLARTTGR